MGQVFVAIGLGATSGLMGVIAYRFRMAWLGWFALAPLAAAVYLYPPLPAGLGGLICGLLIIGANRQVSVPSLVPRSRIVEAVLTAVFALQWGLVFALASWVWPHATPAWGALIMPAAGIALSLGLKIRAPYYWSWFLGSQDCALPVVHIARLGSDLIIPGLLALSATVPAMLLVQVPPSALTAAVAAASVLVIGGALAFGFVSYRRAVRRAVLGATVRVAAVADSPLTFDDHAPEYSDVEGAIARYEPHIAKAIERGAQLIVLPEYGVVVSPKTRPQWLAAVSRWAREAHARVVAGHGDHELHKDQLVIADATGEIRVVYDKQHPAPGLEPKPERRTPPGVVEGDPCPVSAVVCVDNDYADLIRPVSRAGGVLAVPANDWEEIVEMHHRSSVWSAVRAGVPLIRSAGHGISAVYDAAGRVVAQANSKDGPVTLVADVPTAPIRDRWHLWP
jgi:predicted amidohydrolase